MPSMRKQILDYPDIDKGINWADSQCTRALKAGKKPYIEVGVEDDNPKEEIRTDLQNDKMHPMIRDIIEQAVFKLPSGIVRLNHFNEDEGRAILCAWFEKDLESMGEKLKHGSKIIIDPISNEKIAMKVQTSRMLKSELKLFIEWLYATGIDGGVRFSEPALKFYDEWCKK